MQRTEQELIVEMLDIQVTLNEKIDPSWLERNYDWHRAIWTEAAELSGHLGWEWWKSGETDFFQARLELVDIWAFGMSMMIDQRMGEISADFVSSLRDQLNQPRFTCHSGNILVAVDQLACQSSAGIFLPTAFATIMSGLEMTVADLYLWYVGKNTLNRFRQDNGYKTGGYQKIWAGDEDNVHLAEILGRSYDGGLPLRNWVYSQLDNRYRQLCRSELDKAV